MTNRHHSCPICDTDYEKKTSKENFIKKEKLKEDDD
jgi:hypothetical protein